jgi:hypothetical protein
MKPTDIAGAGLIAMTSCIARLGEQTANQLIRHVQHRIGQTRLQIEDGHNQDGATPAGGVANELMSVGAVALPPKLTQALLMDSPGTLPKTRDETAIYCRIAVSFQ